MILQRIYNEKCTTSANEYTFKYSTNILILLSGQLFFFSKLLFRTKKKMITISYLKQNVLIDFLIFFKDNSNPLQMSHLFNVISIF